MITEKWGRTVAEFAGKHGLGSRVTTCCPTGNDALLCLSVSVSVSVSLSLSPPPPYVSVRVDMCLSVLTAWLLDRQ